MRPEIESFLATFDRIHFMDTQGPVAVDFETFYRTSKRAKNGLAEVSVEPLGNWAYCRHPEWEAYMVSIWAPDVQYVGDPRYAPWEKIVGRVWLSHNRNFDRHVYERLWETGVVQVPGFDTYKPSDPPWAIWHDTADLAVWSHLPRNLAGAARQAFRLVLDKGARTDMDGVRWKDVPEDARQRMLDYALEDSILAWALWTKFSPLWPAHERKLSLHTGEIEIRGIPVDRDSVDRAIGVLETAKWRAEQKIPWVNAVDEDTGKPFSLRSKKALNLECMKRGVPPPSTTALKSKDFLEWLDEYGEKVPALLELSRFRRIDRALSVYKALKTRIRPDGRAALGLKYMGAEATGRWAGANKFNLQNLIKVPLYFDAEYNWLDAESGGKPPKAATFAQDIRSCIVASPGNGLIIADLSQIEPRVLNWIVGNREFLAYCAQGMSPYEAHARASMGWTGGNLKKEAPGLYALAKARVLALGYGAGWQKFIEMARGYLGSEEEFLAIFAAPVSAEQEMDFVRYLQWLVDNLGNASAKSALRHLPELTREEKNIWVNAWVQVTEFRKSNPLIKQLWETLDKAFKASVNDGVFENELPSGRTLVYYGITPSGGWWARQGNPESRPKRVYGGLLTENLVQAIARDVFSLGILALEEAGFRVLFTVHDEAVIDAPLGTKVEDVVKLLTTLPAWAKSLPVAAEGETANHYKK